MFQLQTPIVTFEHLDKCSKGFWSQSLPEVIQGHQGSLRFKNKKIAISHKLFNF